MASLKIVVIGNVSVGKTAFCRRYAHDEFTANYKATIGVDFVAKDPYQLWDVAGQERFGSVTKSYYRGALGCVVVVDWTRPDSVEMARKWIKDFQDKYRDDTPIIIVANKADLPHAFSVEEMDALAKGIPQVVGWMTVSAKTGEGIEEAMNELGSHMDKRYLGNNDDDDDDDYVEFQEVENIQRNKTCCF